MKVILVLLIRLIFIILVLFFLRLKQPFPLKDCVQAATTRHITNFKTLACIKHRIIMNQQIRDRCSDQISVFSEPFHSPLRRRSLRRCEGTNQLLGAWSRSPPLQRRRCAPGEAPSSLLTVAAALTWPNNYLILSVCARAPATSGLSLWRRLAQSVSIYSQYRIWIYSRFTFLHTTSIICLRSMIRIWTTF